MEKIVELLTNAENWRTLAVLTTVLCCFFKLNLSFEKKFGFLDKRMDGLDRKIDNVEHSLNKRIDGVETSLGKRIDDLDRKIDNVETALGKRIDNLDRRIDGVEASILNLKTNDFAHLNDTIRALTFMLEKNKFLEKEDKEYIDGRLDR